MRTKMRAHQAATAGANPAIIFASRSAADHGVCVRLRSPGFARAAARTCDSTLEALEAASVCRHTSLRGAVQSFACQCQLRMSLYKHGRLVKFLDYRPIHIYIPYGIHAVKHEASSVTG